MILLDTCTLLYATVEPASLSKKARLACERAWRDGGVYCAATMFEVGWKVARGKLDLGIAFDDWRERVRSIASLSSVAVDEPVWVDAVELDWAHRDPIDRLIVATAIAHRAQLVTEDRAMRDFYPRCVW